MKQKKGYNLLISLVLIVFAFNTQSVMAEENGGVVKTDAVVSFYEEGTASTTSDTDTSGTSTTTSKSLSLLPKTGELQKGYMGAGSFLIGLVVVIWLTRSRNQRGVSE